MRYTAPRRPRLSVLFIRTGSDLPPVLTAEMQETLCRGYCETNQIPISHTVCVHCESEESLEVLRYLLRTLPEQVDSVLATHFFIYSRQLNELNGLTLMYQCHPAWLFSLDLVQPLSKILPTVKYEDYLLADQRYRELLFPEKDSREARS